MIISAFVFTVETDCKQRGADITSSNRTRLEEKRQRVKNENEEQRHARLRKQWQQTARECKRESCNSFPVYWGVRLDLDLLETLIALYPEWFKNCPISALKLYMMTDANNVKSLSSEGGTMIPLSPPKCEVDESPLKKAMDKNKESLKVKLMMRRPISQLVDQGIMPSLKSSAQFHEQQKKLERAKTGDVLKHKIQQRPDREELVRKHILEDTGKVAPSLAEKQRLLKRAKLVDILNDQLSQRPGPLELIRKNILHTDESLERAVKDVDNAVNEFFEYDGYEVRDESLKITNMMFEKWEVPSSIVKNSSQATLLKRW
nr:EOG090X04KW [Artemia franciscana]